MINKIHKELGIKATYSRDTCMPVFNEPKDLMSIEKDIFGRPQKLEKNAAKNWEIMKQAAYSDGITLLVVSAFRSIAYQSELIKKKLDSGQSIKEILKTNAAPGYSEHHSGRALDLTENGCDPLCEAFEETQSFSWLVNNASIYDFSMSYPRNCRFEIEYEPWHWCFRGN